MMSYHSLIECHYFEAAFLFPLRPPYFFSGSTSYTTYANRFESGDHEFTLIVPCRMRRCVTVIVYAVSVAEPLDCLGHSKSEIAAIRAIVNPSAPMIRTATADSGRRIFSGDSRTSTNHPLITRHSRPWVPRTNQNPSQHRYPYSTTFTRIRGQPCSPKPRNTAIQTTDAGDRRELRGQEHIV